jgi:SAM-dependent methyltransferase
MAGVYADIENYYAAKVLRHGPTPLGVDWTCAPTQELRFVQLLKLIDASAVFSINDIGCGYGALAGFLRKRFRDAAIDYFGVDLVAEMIAQARKKNRRCGVRFAVAHAAPRAADYSVASGIFNVMLHHSQDVWHHFIAATLDDMARTSRVGFAVNFLSPLRAGEDGPRELYRAEPGVWIDYCRLSYGVEPALVSGYGLREFTLLVPARP